MKYLYEGNPEKYAQDIISSLELIPSIDIEKVCDSYDIKIYYENINSAEAFLIVANGKKRVDPL
ncbi:MAG: hypothetical protein GXY91_10170 [Clostridia bacterium]|nr:hypothetical protein [Clostridia bacterium]